MTITATGFVVGTAAYMAPEQVQGNAVTAAADIYALGIVIYEMMTGQIPFTGVTPLSTAVKRLNESPPPPRSHAPDLPPHWEATILRCLERDPANRFAAAFDIPRAFAGETSASSPQHRRHQLKRLAIMAALLLAVTAACLVFAKLFHRAPPKIPLAASVSTKARPSIAILGFKNLSGKPDVAWLSTAFCEMLGTELSIGEKVRMIPGENIARAKIELSVPESDSLARDTLARLASNLGTDLVILGSYLVLEGGNSRQIRLDIRLQDASTGDTIAAIPVIGSEGKLFDLIAKAGSNLREKLGAASTTAASTDSVGISMPSIPEAARYYSEGLAKLRLFDALGARDLLEKAVAADPNYPQAHSALAEAWSALGYENRSTDEARIAVDLSSKLPREERLLIEARYRAANKEWEKAADLYRTLFGFFPDNLEYGLLLADAQTAAGKGSDALITVDSLRKLSSPERDDPRIDLSESGAAFSLSDFRRQQAAAGRAAQKGRARGARLLVARARLREGVAYRNLGDLKAAAAAADEARRIYADAGDRGGVAWALNNLANIFDDEGNRPEAKAMFEEVLAVYRETGDKSGIALALGNIASVLLNEGKPADSKKMLEESIRLYREIGDKRGAAWELNTIAIVFKYEGDLAAAQKAYEESLELYRRNGERSGIATELTNLAGLLTSTGDLGSARTMLNESIATFRAIDEVSGVAATQAMIGDLLTIQGDLSQARKNYEEAVEICRRIDDQGDLGIALFGIGEVLLAEGDIAGARKKHEEALSLRTDIGEKAGVAESQRALASVIIEEAQYAEAESKASAAVAVYRDEKMIVYEASAQAVLALARLAQGNNTGAREAINRATMLMERSQDMMTRLTVSIAAARVLTSTRQHDTARRKLEAIIEEATRAGIVTIQFDARLALAEAEMASGDKAAGRKQLEALVSESRAKGFGLIARKAQAAAGR